LQANGLPCCSKLLGEVDARVKLDPIALEYNQKVMDCMNNRKINYIEACEKQDGNSSEPISEKIIILYLARVRAQESSLSPASILLSSSSRTLI
jgi:hypothetical protein